MTTGRINQIALFSFFLSLLRSASFRPPNTRARVHRRRLHSHLHPLTRDARDAGSGQERVGGIWAARHFGWLVLSLFLSLFLSLPLSLCKGTGRPRLLFFSFSLSELPARAPIGGDVNANSRDPHQLPQMGGNGYRSPDRADRGRVGDPTTHSEPPRAGACAPMLMDPPVRAHSASVGGRQATQTSPRLTPSGATRLCFEQVRVPRPTCFPRKHTEPVLRRSRGRGGPVVPLGVAASK